MAQFPSPTSASDIWSLTDVSRAVQGQNWPVMTGFESIATTTVGVSGSSTITFSSIPSGYKHLQVRIMTSKSSVDQTVMSFNGDTSSAKYSFHQLIGNGSTVEVYGYNQGTLPGISPSPRFGAYPYFGIAIIDILDYADTNKNKTTRALVGYDANGSGHAQIVSGCYYSTTAISSMDFVIQGGGNFYQYSHFALYGIKG